MGFEVLDARGDEGAAPSAAGDPPVDIVELDDDPHSGVVLGPPRWQVARTALARVPRGGLELLLPLVAALVVGALVGGFVTGQRAAAKERADRRSVLAVVAQVESSSIGESAGSVEATVTATVTNSGPEPVTLVTDPKGSQPTAAKPVVVTQGGGGSRLEPGASSSVSLAVALQCSGESMPDLSLTVRTADGRPHYVPLRSASSVGTVSALCSNVSASTAQVTGFLQGTTARPVLVLFNGRDVAVRASLGEPRNVDDPALVGLVRITTSPALPMVIGAGDTRQLPLTIEATRCLEDLEALSQLRQISVRPLSVTAADGTRLEDESSADALGEVVDLDLLVGQAVARACR